MDQRITNSQPLDHIKLNADHTFKIKPLQSMSIHVHQLNSSAKNYKRSSTTVEVACYAFKLLSNLENTTSKNSCQYIQVSYINYNTFFLQFCIHLWEFLHFQFHFHENQHTSYSSISQFTYFYFYVQTYRRIDVLGKILLKSIIKSLLLKKSRHITLRIRRKQAVRKTLLRSTEI